MESTIKVSIKMSAFLSTYIENGGTYLCHSLSTMLPKFGETTDDVSTILFNTLQRAYPTFFRSELEKDDYLIDEWLNPEIFKSPLPVGLGIEQSWFILRGEREIVQIREDYLFKCELLRYLIATYGDCDIVVKIEE